MDAQDFRLELETFGNAGRDGNGNVKNDQKVFLVKLVSKHQVSPVLMKMKMRMSVREHVESDCPEGTDGRRLSLMFRRSHQPTLEPVSSSNPKEVCHSCSLIIGKKYRFTAKLDNKHVRGSPVEIIVGDKDHNKESIQITPRIKTFYGELLTNTLHKYLPQSSEVNFLEVQSWVKVFDIPNVTRRRGTFEESGTVKQPCKGKVAIEMPIGICLLTDYFVISTFRGEYCQNKCQSYICKYHANAIYSLHRSSERGWTRVRTRHDV